MFWTEEELSLLQGTAVAHNAMVCITGAICFTNTFLWKFWT